MRLAKAKLFLFEWGIRRVNYAFTDEITLESGEAAGAVVARSATDKATMKASYSVLEYEANEDA